MDFYDYFQRSVLENVVQNLQPDWLVAVPTAYLPPEKVYQIEHKKQIGSYYRVARKVGVNECEKERMWKKKR